MDSLCACLHVHILPFPCLPAYPTVTSLWGHHLPACPNKLQSSKWPGNEKRKAFLLMWGRVKGDLSYAKHREERAITAISLSAGCGRTAGTVWWQIIRILCLNKQQACPREQMSHVNMHGHRDKCHTGLPIKGEEMQHYLECCFLGTAATKEWIIGLIHLAIDLRHTHFHLTLWEQPGSHGSQPVGSTAETACASPFPHLLMR